MTGIRIRYGALAVLLAGPTGLAFFSGGYFDEPRAWAGAGAWLLVAVALCGGATLPRSLNARLALGGLGLLGAWTLASMAWAPAAGEAYHAGQLVLLYAGALLAATLLLREARALRMLEPALVAGVVIVIGYGLSERLVPGILHFARSLTSQGRLEQPLTYWNATGELAALGLVLAARLAGDERRPVAMRALAAAAAPVLGMGLYLSFSRGALLACGAGLLVLLAAAPRREALEAILVSAGGGALAALTAAPFRGLTSLSGSLGSREREGILVLIGLVAITGLAGWVQGAAARRRHPAPPVAPRHALRAALLVSGAGLAAAVLAAALQGTTHQLETGAGRFVTLASDRYDFWNVAVRAFMHAPLIGVGAGGWQVWWLHYRPFPGFARDAHSLPLQTAAELGLVGLLGLAAVFAGVGLAARQAHGRAPAPVAGPLAGAVVYAIHAPLDWDWQMPAVTLPALLLAGALLAAGEAARPGAEESQRAAGNGGTSAKKLRSARRKVAGEPAEERASATQARTF